MGYLRLFRLGLLGVAVVALSGTSWGAGPGLASPSGVTALAAGGFHTCALTTAGGLRCWGSNATGQLGDGSNTNSSTPVDVFGLGSGAAAVAAGFDHNCAVTTAGGLKCWGYNFWGQVGDGTTEHRAAPVDVAGFGSGVAAVAAGGSHTCALGTAGGVQCWGYNLYGQLGDGTTTSRVPPAPVTGLDSGAAGIIAGFNHTCALTMAGALKCWGYNLSGQLGDGTTTNRSVPVNVPALQTGVAAVTAGVAHTCALTTAGGVKCWGDNLYGQLGDGTNTDRTAPVDVSGLQSGVAAVAAGGFHTCAVTTSGGVKCWGGNIWGQLGDGTTVDSASPVGVSGLSGGVVGVSARFDHTCAVTASAGVKCWGRNSAGQLGDGTTTDSSTPVDVLLSQPDADGDGVPDSRDNCPGTANPGQENSDGDTLGDACDNDNDNDGYWDGDETLKGSQPLDVASTPEHCDGLDNDADTAVDEQPTGGNWDIDGDTVKDCLDTNVDTDGDGTPNTADADDDGDGRTDAQERGMSTDELAGCPSGAGHDAWAADADHDKDADIGDVIQTFGMGKINAPANYDARSDADGDVDVDIGDVIQLYGMEKIGTKCVLLTYANSTGGPVDDIHIVWNAPIAEMFSARDSELAAWSNRTLSGDGLTLEIDRPDGAGDLASGGQLTVVVRGANPVISSCRWTLDGVDKGPC